MFQQSDLDICQSLQLEECEVLESIYPGYISGLSRGYIKLEIPVELGVPKTVAVIDDGTITASGLTSETKPEGSEPIPLSLATLPPLLLHVFLPGAYPLYCPPEILSLRATDSWLPHLHILQKCLIGMWQTGEVVLYNWIEYLRNAEFFEVLKLKSDGVIHIPHPAPPLLVSLLLLYDISTQTEKFSHNTYTCSICFAEYKGARCLRLLCSHVFCRSCLEEYWKLSIAEGDVRRVGCPDPECIKAGREADEEEVVRVVTEEELRRWRWLREKRVLDKDPTIIHCPMAFCQTPVPKPATEENRGYDSLRTCSECSYSFCSFCKRTWHGPHSACPIPSVEAFIVEYLALPADSALREVMGRRYGHANIMKLVSRYEEEQSTQKWLANSTMACPGCHIHVEKSLGCNHMTCSKCQQHFCYRCGVKIQASCPYEHFSTPGMSCYKKLFDSENGPPVDELE